MVWGVVFAVAAEGYKQYQGSSARGDSREDRREARRIERELTQEELRRMDRDHAERLGMATASVATSGTVASEGTSVATIKQLKSEQEIERTALEKVGISRIRELRAQGKALDRISLAQDKSSAISTMQSIGESQNWWQS